MQIIVLRVSNLIDRDMYIQTTILGSKVTSGSTKNKIKLSRLKVVLNAQTSCMMP